MPVAMNGHRIEPLFHRVANLDVAVPVRFGGADSRMHRMILRFGDVSYGTIHGSVLAEHGDSCLIARDIIAWDAVTRGFTISDAEALAELGERLDFTTAFLGGVASGCAAIVSGTIDLLVSLLTPSFFVIGGLAVVLAFWVGRYLIVWMVWHWAILAVIVPGFLIVAVCGGIRDARIRRLHNALLNAAHNALGTQS